MDDDVKKSDIASSALSDVNNQATEPATKTDGKKPVDLETNESREEKLRRAKIAMEGLDLTIRREAKEKEEEASEEKQQLNKLLLSLDHEKELLELTWVNWDDKRTNLKKILEPIIEKEGQLESDENNLESQEGVTLDPKAKREIEKKRWNIQEERKKTEEEKWLIEEKIEKIDEQIIEVKDKYQQLLKQEEELRQKIQTIEEQMILQQEILRQQRELEEQRKRQEALKKIEEEKRRAEIEQRRLAEIAEAEKAKKKAEEEKQKTESASTIKTQIDLSTEKNNLEKLRLAEEERQKQETAKRLQQQDQEAELRKKIIETIEASSQTEKEKTKEKINEKDEDLRRALELERIRRENEEADMERKSKLVEKNRSVIEEIKKSPDSLLEPLRTLKGDLASAMKDQTPNQTSSK